MVPWELADEEEDRYERKDKFGNLWFGKKEALAGRKVLDIIEAEWGSRKRCLVKRPSRTYVYCRCSEKCRMVVQYGSEDGKLVREGKDEHRHGEDVRGEIRSIASQPQRAAAALVEWSIAHPDGNLPARQQIQTRKQYTRSARVEDKIVEVLGYVQSVKERGATEPWHCRVLEVDESAGIFCYTTDFYVSLLVEHWETLMEHGLRLACDGTHDISNSRIKLIAVGWLAQHVPRQSIETTFVLLGFALAPSENHVAVRLLLDSLDAHVREHLGDGLRKASVAHIDGGPALVKAFVDFFGQDFQLVRSLEHVKRNIREQGVKKLTQSSWWTSTKRWVSKSAFIRNNYVFDRYWHHCFQLLENAGEANFVAYLQTEHFQKDAGVWTAAWRAAILDPGYGSYSLNAVDSFWKLLDQYVPEEKTLPLRQVMERYEHTGRVFQNDGKWSALSVEPSTLVTAAMVGEASAELSPRLDWKDDKQVGRMSSKTLERMLGQEATLMLEFNTGQENATKVFCKYGPSDYNAVEMEALFELERSTSSATVDAALQKIGALDADGFHPRRVSATYEKFTALYEEEGQLLESHRDFWQRGVTEHYIHVSTKNLGAKLPEVFSSLVPRTTPTGRPRGRPKGIKRPSRDSESAGRGRSRGRGRGSKKRPAADGIATGVEQQLEDLFGEKAASHGLEHLLGSDFAGDTTAPGTPPEVAARLESLVAEGRLPRTTAEQRRRNNRTSGTTYGVPPGLKEALEAGYIHPNLPAPQGMVWNLVARKTFVLQARGG
ncbi:unnamed protein product [Symbiodinium natans]|uniref:Uncharacterized protein n=2 Tax=Symbiodinium natans TaxID=878477 RepID=A0A812HC81_9DINO|nr:unnamed protein product [Symbiodinium natans]